MNLRKYFKKRRLIKKYTPDYAKQLYLLNMMKEDQEFCAFYRHQIYCELRALSRLKRL
jgi:hypothetical protein